MSLTRKRRGMDSGYEATRVRASCICAYDISAYIIPLNAVSYRVERLAAGLCFSAENQPKPLL